MAVKLHSQTQSLHEGTSYINNYYTIPILRNPHNSIGNYLGPYSNSITNSNKESRTSKIAHISRSDPREAVAPTKDRSRRRASGLGLHFGSAYGQGSLG